MGSKPNFLKVIILGDGAVGKSALMNRFVNNKFDSQSFHTIGVEFLNKDVKVHNESYTLQIWDTAGQERFKSLRTPFYRGSDICLLVYSVDDNQSFLNLDVWRREFLYYADVKDPDHFPFVVLGNKVDLSAREVRSEQVDSWCKNNGNMPYFETSAKEAINVDSAFITSVERLLKMEKYLDKQMKTGAIYTNAVNLDNKGNSDREREPKSGCC